MKKLKKIILNHKAFYKKKLTKIFSKQTKSSIYKLSIRTLIYLKFLCNIPNFYKVDLYLKS